MSKKIFYSTMVIMMILIIGIFASADTVSTTYLNGFNVGTIRNYSTIQGGNITANNLFIQSPPAACSSTNYFVTQFVGNASICTEINTSVLSITNAAGWANYSTATGTNLNVGIGKTTSILDLLEINADSTGKGITFTTNTTSAFSSSFKLQKTGNSTTASGTPASSDEIGTIEWKSWNLTSYVRRSLIQTVASQAHTPGIGGSDIIFYNTMRGFNSHTIAMRIASYGVVISNTSISNPSHRLVVNGDANITQMLVLNAYAYPPCTAAVKYNVAVNSTHGRPVFCNGSTWINLTTYG